MDIGHPAEGKLLTGPQLAKMVGLKKSRIAQLAKTGRIPGAIRPNNYHFKFPLTPELRDWIDWKSRQVDQKKQPPRETPRERPLVSIHGIRQEFDMWLSRIEPKIKGWNDELLEEARLELAAFVHFHKRIVAAQQARRLR
jgi:hypothetical protein